MYAMTWHFEMLCRKLMYDYCIVLTGSLWASVRNRYLWAANVKIVTNHFSLLSSEAPRVSLNVEPRLSLQVGEEQKFACEAERYYPLEVGIVWYKEDPAVGQRTGSLLPNMIPSTLLSGHKQNSDRTYSLTSFFYLTASLSDSGKRFTCSVSHQSLRVAIKKSFILTVEGEMRNCSAVPRTTTRRQHIDTNCISYPFSSEPSSWISTSFLVLIVLTLMLVLFVSLRILHQGKYKDMTWNESKSLSCRVIVQFDLELFQTTEYSAHAIYLFFSHSRKKISAGKMIWFLSSCSLYASTSKSGY